MSRKSDKPAQSPLGLQKTSVSAPEQASPAALTGEVCPSIDRGTPRRKTRP